jgi:hypothetical protein
MVLAAIIIALCLVAIGFVLGVKYGSKEEK